MPQSPAPENEKSPLVLFSLMSLVFAGVVMVLSVALTLPSLIIVVTVFGFSSVTLAVLSLREGS